MLIPGSYYTLKISRTTENGQYLVNEEGDEVLLPNRYVTEEIKEGDPIEVFIYNDSEDRLVATTETPLVKAGEAAWLEVVDKTIHGAFFNWGLPKDLFLPVRNQIGRVDIGQKYVVFVYVDNVTGRMTATTKLNSFIKNTEITVKPGDEVDILVALKNPLGYRVVIDNLHWGMIYSNEIFRPLAIGDRTKAYIRRITEDNRIDVSLQQQGYDEVKNSADRLLELIRENNGTLRLSDNSSPEEIHRITRMSKKLFKRSAGYLMKKNLIVMDENSIVLK